MGYLCLCSRSGECVCLVGLLIDLFLLTVGMSSDADTANNHLIISDDLTMWVFQTEKEGACSVTQSFYLCPALRPHHLWLSLLGRQTQGQAKKDVGVCKESVHSQQTILPYSERGFWTVSERNREFFSASTTPFTNLSVSTPLTIKPRSGFPGCEHCNYFLLWH